MNNPITLNYFADLNLFQRDPTREQMTFQPPIDPNDRRDIHEMAQALGLYHVSQGEQQNRKVIISKTKISSNGNGSPPVQPVPSYSTWNNDHRHRVLNRAATFDLSEARESGHYNQRTLGRQSSDLLGVPGSPGLPNLPIRGAKSFADLRSYTPSPVPSASSFPVNLNQNVQLYTDYQHANSSSSAGTPNLTPTLGRDAHRDDAFLLNGMGNMTIGDRSTVTRTNMPVRLGQDRENYTSNAGPIQRPGNGVFDETPRVSNVPERQPRGPANQEYIGFTRGRQNGHANRGSGELDLSNIITRSYDDNTFQDSSDRNGGSRY